MSDACGWREDHDGDQEGGEGDGDHGHVGGDYDERRSSSSSS